MGTIMREPPPKVPIEPESARESGVAAPVSDIRRESDAKYKENIDRLNRMRDRDIERALREFCRGR